MSSFDVQSMPDSERRRLFTDLVRDFAERGSSESPVLEGVLTADQVAVTVAAMMKSADVTSFELAALFNV